MSTTLDTLFIIIGVILVLMTATVVIEIVRTRWSADQQNPAIENLSQRIRGWWYMVFVLALALLAGRTGVIILSVLISFGAMREFLSLTAKRRADHKALVLCYYVILPVQYLLVYFNIYSVFLIFIPVYSFFALAIVQSLSGDTTNYLARVAETQWAMMISVYSVSYAPALMGLEIAGYEGRNVLLIAYLVLIVQGSDVMQYLMSEWLGGRKISPRLMPSRTWPGVVTGVLSMCILGSLLFWMTPFNYWQAFLISFILCVTGLFGSLVMRAIKRDRGVRQWGHMIAGHGGVVDRLDSIMFSAPIFFHIVHYFW